MRNIMRPIERLLFGATAEERVATMMALVDQRVECTLKRAFEALNEPEEDQQLPDEPELWITNIRRPAGWGESEEA